MMAAENPICTRFVNSLPDNRVQIAGMLVLFGIALFIESPVIDLLATSTTLAKGPQSFAAIRKFAVRLMVWCGALHLLVALTPPLFDFVLKDALSQSQEVTDAIRLPLLIMVPWSPAIGWRRHVQGLLIRNGFTKPIGLGTLVRVSSVCLVAYLGFASGRLPGAVVAAVALTFSVIAEAVFIHLAAKRFLPSAHWHEEEDGDLKTSDLMRFHSPLTLSTMVMLTAGNLVAKALANAPNHLFAMNAWQVSITLAFLIRTITFALPEVVIANWRGGDGARLLARFCGLVGVSLSGLMLLCSFLGLDVWFFTEVTKADRGVAQGAHAAFLASSLMPTLTALSSYFKGVLTVRKVTGTRVWATVSSVGVLGVILWVGVQARWQGIFVAAGAVTASQLTELCVLAVFAFAGSKGKAVGAETVQISSNS
ncbi:MAG: hypothetical protein JSS66_10095 [Armatimonadetes bacterium]|nr:hypothetical protein [Armatimonadota bacterium]